MIYRLNRRIFDDFLEKIPRRVLRGIFYSIFTGDQMKKQDLEFFKNLLNEQLETLLKEADLAVTGIKETGNHYTDPLDRASFDEGQSMQLRIKNRESNLIKKIKESLERIEEGSFGICESCGKDIPVKRLMVRPVTNKCIECKTKEEAYEKVSGM